MYFAQDPTDLAAAETFLHEAMAAAAGELRWIALVDGAFDHGRELPAAIRQGVNCYAAEYPLSDLVRVAPWLIELRSGEEGRRQRSELIAHCNGRPMLSVMASRISARALASRWMPLHHARTSDGQRLLLRFADTRTLPLLPTILEPAQWRALAGPLAHWFHLNREGAMAACTLPEQGEDVAMASMHLAQPQIDAMVKASEVDAALELLAGRMTEVFAPNVAHGKLHAYIQDKTFGLIARHGVDHWNDKVALVNAELLSNGAIHDVPDLLELLLNRAWQPGRLWEAMEERGIVRKASGQA